MSHIKFSLSKHDDQITDLNNEKSYQSNSNRLMPLTGCCWDDQHNSLDCGCLISDIDGFAFSSFEFKANINFTARMLSQVSSTGRICVKKVMQPFR
ncbi:CLUMA_CG013592, isoform A [Clunio marinus]|uniref:CLUMA_CG013592, isoform A n=1 Tax=Clunio marinus TaxID=568069 RepID=A0A1J1IJ97_9DIPT|nr:CLUMA_CG013592, isoform A [Clunio marinus]